MRGGGWRRKEKKEKEEKEERVSRGIPIIFRARAAPPPWRTYLIGAPLGGPLGRVEGGEGFCGPEEFLFFSRFFFPFPSFSFFFLPTNFPRAPRSSRDPGFILYLGKARHVTRRR